MHWKNQNSETMLIYDMLQKHSYDFVLGYMTALSVIENPPNNGIDYKWCVDFMGYNIFVCNAYKNKGE